MTYRFFYVNMMVYTCVPDVVNVINDFVHVDISIFLVLFIRFTLTLRGSTKTHHGQLYLST